ncbi:MAG: O-antigen ligase family protein [Chloroflexota bacterium]
MPANFLLSVSHWFNFLARICFALVLILAPCRWRIVLLSRPTFPIYPDYTDFLLYASDIILIFMLVFWASSLLISPHKVKLGSASIWVPLTGLTLAGFVSTFGGEDDAFSRYQAVRLVSLFLFYLYIVNEINVSIRPERTLSQAKGRSKGGMFDVFAAWVLIPVGLQLILQSLISIPQSLLQHSLGLASLGELRLNAAVAGVSIVPLGELRFLRVYGLTDHPNILGGCLAFGLVLLFGWMMYGKNRIRWLALVAFLPGLLALIMTFSRSAWLGFLIGTSFMVGLEAFLMRWDSVKRGVFIAIPSLIVLIPFIAANIQLFQTRMTVGAEQIERFEQQSLGERPFLIRSGATIFMEHSTIGVGLGTSPLALKSRFAEFPTNYQPPHLTLLTAAMETGVFGAVFYLFLMIIPIILFLSHWRTYAEQPIMLSSFILLLALMVVGLFDYYPWLNNAGRIWQWLAWGLFSAANMNSSVSPFPNPLSNPLPS